MNCKRSNWQGISLQNIQTAHVAQYKKQTTQSKNGQVWGDTSLVAQRLKRLPLMQETQVRSLGWEDPLEKEMATHSSTLAWKLPWLEEPGGLQSMGLLRVRHNWATSLFTFMHRRRKWQPTPMFLPGESQGWGSWWAAVYGVAQSWTWLKRLSSKETSQQRRHTDGQKAREKILNITNY